MHDTGRDFWADEYWGSDRATFEDELGAFRERTAAAEIGHRIRPIRRATRTARAPRATRRLSVAAFGQANARRRPAHVRRTVRVGRGY